MAIFNVVTIVLAVVFSLFVAYSSVSSVWVPHQLSDNVFHEENALGQYQGMFPWSKLSYPFFMSVYHTPFSQLTFQGSYAFGRARFTVFFANFGVFQIDGTFFYVVIIYGAAPLHYNMDYGFSDESLFDFLVVFYTFVNIIGAFIGVIIARTLYRKVYAFR